MDVPTLLSLQSRGEIKRWGAWLDGEGAPLRGRLLEAARARGAPLTEACEALDGKRLLRACLARAGEAQVRRNPIPRDEAFRCAHCGLDVPAGGRRPRDHCPACLHSLHVDVVPGDRAAGCGGLLVPRALVRAAKGELIVYRCARCGMERRNRVLSDIEPPDDAREVRKLVVQTATIG
jgi:DNA-directed RNA polymerase subunit RPC12/RpoP